MKYILFFLLIVLIIFLVKIVAWGTPIMDMIHNWKYLGKLPKGSSVPYSVPLECLDSKNMSSYGCSSDIVNEYNLPDVLLFA